MGLELNLRFPDESHVETRFDDEESGLLPFENPLTAADRRDLVWYLEVYGANSLGDPDDAQAAAIAARLPVLGKALFAAVFQGPALRLFQRFQDQKRGRRLLTIAAEHPEILAIPWELLRDPTRGGVYLFQENPRISIRRKLAGATGGRAPFRVKPRFTLHILFVVSRPEGAGFLDPRAESRAVLDALEEHAGRVSWEFLRPATLDALLKRLGDSDLVPVDVLHFDGHGVFDRRGGLPERFAKAHRLGRSDLLRASVGTASAPNTGYLLFETAEGEVDFVSAGKLGENLHQNKVALVVLSACQSAAFGDEEEPAAGTAAPAATAPDGLEAPAERAMGSVAARLTAAGIPAVLAMTHSVLATTTRALFGAFYGELARPRGIGEALDHARRHLINHPEKYEVQRQDERVWLTLQDWFVPALYQSGKDVRLLAMPKKPIAGMQPLGCNLPPAPEAGFHGRRLELWQIERWLAGPTRRITLTGFGGQGKTALAQEAGRWLLRTWLVDAVVFVDYARLQATDALAVAVSTIGSVLGKSLPDAEAARKALAATYTLVILDNLEVLAPEPLGELLDAAVGWSEARGSRVLLTTRRPDLGHAGYRVEGTLVHRRIQLAGLGSRRAPDDALEWFAELSKLPPAPRLKTPRREELIDLFGKVRFHPLSIRVLAQQLKTRLAAELGERLEQLLASPAPAGAEDDATLPELVASLQLSLDRLDPAARALLPRLGVFQGGAMENMLLEITEIPEANWPDLRRQLEAAALLEAENLPGVTVPFVRFHPTLALMLWAQTDLDEQARLGSAHRQRYSELAEYLYFEDQRAPYEARAISRHELPNLLHSVHAALAKGDPDGVRFADRVTLFLDYFGLPRERTALADRAQAAAGEVGSASWFLAWSNQGEQLQAAGRVQEATKVFGEVLRELGAAPSYKRAVTLVHLGRCHRDGGRPDLAELKYRESLAVLDRLEPSTSVHRHRAASLTALADVLAAQGRFAEARKAYQESLTIAEKIGELRGQGVVLGQLGSLALSEGNLEEAAKRHRDALSRFQQLGEPAMEAVAWHQLGIVFHQTRQWDEAERHYREAARLSEALGNLAAAAATWNHLALVNEGAGKPAAAETWYRKAIEVGRQTGDILPTARALSNLANLLRAEPGRLAEARQMAEASLAIDLTFDPGAAEIWKSYSLLANFAEQEHQPTKAREYRRLAREAKRNFPGTRHELRRYAQLILAVLAACAGQEEARQAVARYQAAMRQGGEEWSRVAGTLDCILAGERDPEALSEGLHVDAAMIIETILAGLANPESIRDLFE